MELKEEDFSIFEDIEDITNNNMLFDDELKDLEDKKEGLESDCIKIKNQLEENKLKAERYMSGESTDVPRSKEWVIKANNALAIKKLQIKKLNREIEHMKSISATTGEKKKLGNKINEAFKNKLVDLIGEDGVLKIIENIKSGRAYDE